MSHVTATALDPSTTIVGFSFTAAVVLHNLEEAIFLVPWMKRHLPRLWFTPRQRIYGLTSSLVSVVVSLVAAAWAIWPQNTELTYALCGFALAMSFNAVVPHLALTLQSRSYSPGTATGILLNLPLGIWLIDRLVAGGWLVGQAVWRHSSLYAVALGLSALGGVYIAHALYDFIRGRTAV